MAGPRTALRGSTCGPIACSRRLSRVPAAASVRTRRRPVLAGGLRLDRGRRAPHLAALRELREETGRRCRAPRTRPSRRAAPSADGAARARGQRRAARLSSGAVLHSIDARAAPRRAPASLPHAHRRLRRARRRCRALVLGARVPVSRSRQRRADGDALGDPRGAVGALVRSSSSRTSWAGSRRRPTLMRCRWIKSRAQCGPSSRPSQLYTSQ